jgi:hypothetical protein
VSFVPTDAGSVCDYDAFDERYVSRTLQFTDTSNIVSGDTSGALQGPPPCPVAIAARGLATNLNIRTP